MSEVLQSALSRVELWLLTVDNTPFWDLLERLYNQSLECGTIFFCSLIPKIGETVLTAFEILCFVFRWLWPYLQPITVWLVKQLKAASAEWMKWPLHQQILSVVCLLAVLFVFFLFRKGIIGRAWRALKRWAQKWLLYIIVTVAFVIVAVFHTEVLTNEYAQFAFHCAIPVVWSGRTILGTKGNRSSSNVELSEAEQRSEQRQQREQAKITHRNVRAWLTFWVVSVFFDIILSIPFIGGYVPFFGRVGWHRLLLSLRTYANVLLFVAILRGDSSFLEGVFVRVSSVPSRLLGQLDLRHNSSRHTETHHMETPTAEVRNAQTQSKNLLHRLLPFMPPWLARIFSPTWVPSLLATLWGSVELVMMLFFFFFFPGVTPLGCVVVGLVYPFYRATAALHSPSHSAFALECIKWLHYATVHAVTSALWDCLLGDRFKGARLVSLVVLQMPFLLSFLMEDMGAYHGRCGTSVWIFDVLTNQQDASKSLSEFISLLKAAAERTGGGSSRLRRASLPDHVTSPSAPGILGAGSSIAAENSKLRRRSAPETSSLSLSVPHASSALGVSHSQSKPSLNLSSKDQGEVKGEPNADGGGEENREKQETTVSPEEGSGETGGASSSSSSSSTGGGVTFQQQSEKDQKPEPESPMPPEGWTSVERETEGGGESEAGGEREGSISPTRSRSNNSKKGKKSPRRSDRLKKK
uniref:Transmembrane protein n=1 Tax=Chromera velia CCMP2878 TaxID=1169474 RepID=A0A0G4GI67_9ALVE|eukprot:Cvel_21949.t1-p1 / transcript=Cvel_21949.t1 / gene=Cvel_21949 / organism=Chromera_velia_CCMP2878 / gene_product=hypothetical protein / transcript_product=hypothetical protein / location=Cvel_scaffold2107:16461-18542(-) / protein_length=694 / sequence_SO=supercontig / SO=protein_coding / is_pseudo=false